MSKVFSVTIHYREPVYAETRGVDDLEYRGTFEVVAPSEDEAVRLATARFKEAAQRSSVSWVREITRVTVNGLVEDGSNTPTVIPPKPGS